MGDIEELERLLAESEPGLAGTALRAILLQYEVYMTFARRQSLGSDIEPGRAHRHIREAVFSAPLFRGRVLDVGAGAGYPTVTVAILRPHLEVHLCERSRKKGAFLEYLLARLRLPRVSVHVEPVETLVREEDPWDTIAARALPGLSELLPMLLQASSPGGQLLLFLGASGGTALASELSARGWVSSLRPDPSSRNRVLLQAERRQQ